jgi:RNA polymerase sigma-70 factor (ECF subfamily)
VALGRIHPSAPSDDAEILERARRGDDAAFGAFYARHARYVAGVVYRLLGSDGDLDDLVQETFVDASHGLAGLDHPEHVRSWLATITVRRVARLLERRRRWRWLGGQMGALSAKMSDPAARQPVDELYDALDRLPPDLRIPWILSRIEEEPLPEVARICGVSLATVKRKIASAEERLRRRTR